ncbi:MAG: VCBS repeat-containing protein [Acidobacteria bacterium]|nr:VCBS repeat-containing protein [Acidobacteriota bacterium]
MKTTLLRGYRLLPPVCAAILMAVPMVQAGKAPPDACPSPQTRIQKDARSTAMLIPLPGRPVSYALPRGSDGTRQIMLLMVPDHEKTEPDDFAKERVLQALAVGEFEELFAGQERIEIDGGRMQIQVPNTNSSDRPYTEAIVTALKAAGINLGSGFAGNSPCPPLEPVAGPALYRLQPHTQPGWTLVQNLPAGDATAIGALDLDGDGQDELLLESEGRLFRIQAGDDGRYAGPPILLFTDPDLRLRADEPREVHFPPEPVAVRSPLDDDNQIGPLGDRQGPAYADLAGRLNPLHMRVTSLGLLKIYVPGASGESWLLQSRITLPTRGLPLDSMLLLAGPEVRTVGRNRKGNLLLAAGPVPYGDQRLLTTIIELDALESPRVQEIWSRLPRGEMVVQSGYMTLDGEPFLWVKTDNESEVQLFGDSEALRIFPLTQDPSRAGVQPILSFNKMKGLHETRMKYGQDVNGDGRDDLVFIGRDEGVLVIGSYLQTRDGKFKRSVNLQKIGEDEKPLAFGVDLDGDNLPDLVTSTGQEVRIHAGVPAAVKGKNLTLVTPDPVWRAARRRSSAEAREQVNCRDLPVFSDLDGDGRSERVCSGVDGYGRPFFKILKFTPSPESSGLPAGLSPAATAR